MDNDPALEKGRKLTARIRQAMLWMPAFTLLYFIAGVVLVILSFIVQESTLNQYVLDHAPAVIGIPVSIILALGIVVSFEVSSDKEFKVSAQNFELSGPAIPVLLWVVVFLALITSIKLLW